MKAWIAVLVLLLIPLSVGQGGFGEEDFEDDTVGSVPSQSWYDFTREATGSNENVAGLKVITPGLVGTDQAFNFFSQDSTGGQVAAWEFAEDEYEFFSFFATVEDTGDPTGTGTFETCRDPESVDGAVICSSATFTNVLAQCSIIDNATAWRFVCDGVNLAFNAAFGDEFFFTFQMDYSADTTTFFVDGEVVGSAGFVGNNANTMGFSTFNIARKGAGAVPSFVIDQISLSDEPLAFVPDPPTGLKGEVVKLGSETLTGKALLEWNLSPLETNTDVGDFDYNIYLDNVFLATDTVDANDGGGARSYVHLFTGSSSFGVANFTVTAQSGLESDPSCEITLDLDVFGDFDECGLEVSPGSSPAEFDSGFVAAVESFGFFTDESQHFFSLILVGLVTVVAGASSKWVAPSRWKNMLILGAGALIAVFTVLIDFLELWEFLVALMLGIFAVRGAGEARNTFFEIQSAIRQRNAPEVLKVADPFPSMAVNDAPEGPEVAREPVEAVDGDDEA